MHTETKIYFEVTCEVEVSSNLPFMTFFKVIHEDAFSNNSHLTFYGLSRLMTKEYICKCNKITEINLEYVIGSR